MENLLYIDLLTENSISFGSVPVGGDSLVEEVFLKNIGSAPLTINSTYFYQENSQFSIYETEFPIVLAVDDSVSITVSFSPTVNGTVNDTLYIHSNAQNTPTIIIDLSGTGVYAPPSRVTEVNLSIESEDVIISWDPVIETIYGTPIDPDYYIVLYSDCPDEDISSYQLLANTTSFFVRHPDILLSHRYLFYRIIAVKLAD